MYSIQYPQTDQSYYDIRRVLSQMNLKFLYNIISIAFVMIGSKSIAFGIIAPVIVAISVVVITANLSGFALAQNKTSNMSKTVGNMTIAINKTSFAGASNPTMAGKIANATK
ncbi:MAG: hypothetical protein WCC17_19395 [Candidatus Nitrosopolaris sp.]